MAEKEVVEINGRELPKDEVDSFLGMWDIFTYYNHATPESVLNLLAFSYITNELPSDEVLEAHQVKKEDFTAKLVFYGYKLAEDKRISSQQRQEDENRWNDRVPFWYWER